MKKNKKNSATGNLNKTKCLQNRTQQHVAKPHLKQDLRMVPSSSLIVGIVGACEAGVGSVDAVAGVFCGVGAVARSSTLLFLIYCFSDIVNCRRLDDGLKVL